jgi:hypothetical protein
MAAAGWFKFWDHTHRLVDTVAAAVFAYRSRGNRQLPGMRLCSEGTGWFTALPGSSPALGMSRPSRTTRDALGDGGTADTVAFGDNGHL